MVSGGGAGDDRGRSGRLCQGSSRCSNSVAQVLSFWTGSGCSCPFVAFSGSVIRALVRFCCVGASNGFGFAFGEVIVIPLKKFRCRFLDCLSA